MNHPLPLLMVLVMVHQPFGSYAVLQRGLPEGHCQALAMRMNFDLQAAGVYDRRAECRHEE